MTLLYDFDVIDRGDVVCGDDDALLQRLNATSLVAADHPLTLARFRDDQTVEALRRAHPALREYFLASGFALTVSGAELPPNFYCAREEALRLGVIERLTANARKFDLTEADSPGKDAFRLVDFLQHLGEARPFAVKLDALDAITLPGLNIGESEADHGRMAARVSRFVRGLVDFGHFRRPSALS